MKEDGWDDGCDLIGDKWMAINVSCWFRSLFGESIKPFTEMNLLHDQVYICCKVSIVQLK